MDKPIYLIEETRLNDDPTSTPLLGTVGTVVYVVCNPRRIESRDYDEYWSGYDCRGDMDRMIDEEFQSEQEAISAAEKHISNNQQQ